MAERFNCPNCGAPIESNKCPFCGTVIYDFSCLELHKENYIRIKVNNTVTMLKVFLAHIREDWGEPKYLYADDTPVMVSDSLPEIHMDFRVVKELNGVYAKSIKLEG